MSSSDDNRIVDLLYGELSEREAADYRRALESDPAAKGELEAYGALLETFRSVEDDEPSPHLDALILAHARQAAEETANKSFFARLGKWIASPLAGVAVAGTLAAIVAVVLVPVAMLKSSREGGDLAYAPMSAPPAQKAVEAPAGVVLEAVPAAPEPAAEPVPDNEPAIAAGKRGDRPRANADDPLGFEPREEAKKRARRAEQLAASKEEAAEQERAFAESRVAKDEAKPAEPPAVGRVAEGSTDSFRQDDDTAAKLRLGAGAKGTQSGAGAGVEKQRSEREAPPPPPARQPVTASPPAEATADAEGAVADGLKADRTPAPQKPAAAVAPKPSAAMTPAQADELARSLIRAAETALEGGDFESARRTLFNGLVRTRGTPAYGMIALRYAEMAEGTKRYAEALAHAKQAAQTPGFARRDAALRLVHRMARLTGNTAESDWATRELSR